MVLFYLLCWLFMSMIVLLTAPEAPRYPPADSPRPGEAGALPPRAAPESGPCRSGSGHPRTAGTPRRCAATSPPAAARYRPTRRRGTDPRGPSPSRSPAGPPRRNVPPSLEPVREAPPQSRARCPPQEPQEKMEHPSPGAPSLHFDDKTKLRFIRESAVLRGTPQDQKAHQMQHGHQGGGDVGPGGCVQDSLGAI